MQVEKGTEGRPVMDEMVKCGICEKWTNERVWVQERKIFVCADCIFKNVKCEPILMTFPYDAEESFIKDGTVRFRVEFIASQDDIAKIPVGADDISYTGCCSHSSSLINIVL